MINEFIDALDFSSPAAHGFVAFVCTWLGYRLSVQWNMRQIEASRKIERENLFKTIKWFLCRCCIAARDGKALLIENKPPHRPIPSEGIGHFHARLMDFMEDDVVVSVSSLGSAIEQANHPLSIMNDLFTKSSIPSVGPALPDDSLCAYCEETIRRFDDIIDGCKAVSDKIEIARTKT